MVIHVTFVKTMGMLNFSTVQVVALALPIQNPPRDISSVPPWAHAEFSLEKASASRSRKLETQRWVGR
jgi:hypothetical protein